MVTANFVGFGLSAAVSAAILTVASATWAEETTPPPPAGAATPAPAATGTPVEVVVQGDRTPPSGQSFNAGQARFVPGTFGDPLRAVETLPGIAPTASGLPYFYVRGAPPANTGYFIDGIPVPLLFHIGPGPSVVAPGVLDHVDLYQGPAPVRYGRYVGGVIAAETRPPSDTPRLEYGARLFDANVLGELPFDDKTSVLVASRYGYPNIILSAVAPDLSLNYWDYLVRLSHRPTPRDTLAVRVRRFRPPARQHRRKRHLRGAISSGRSALRPPLR